MATILSPTGHDARLGSLPFNQFAWSLYWRREQGLNHQTTRRRRRCRRPRVLVFRRHPRETVGVTPRLLALHLPEISKRGRLRLRSRKSRDSGKNVPPNSCQITKGKVEKDPQRALATAAGPATGRVRKQPTRRLRPRLRQPRRHLRQRRTHRQTTERYESRRGPSPDLCRDALEETL
jgi:hypothetical protein